MAIMDNLPSLPSSEGNGLSVADRKMAIMGIWLVSAIMLVFSNRYILIDLHFASPITLVAWQAFCVLFSTQTFNLHSRLAGNRLAKDDIEPITWEMYYTYIIPLGALFGFIPLWSTIASSTLPLWQMAILQGLTPLMTAWFSRFLGIRITLSKFIYISIVMAALVIAGIGGIRFDKFDTHLTEKQLYGAAWTGIQSYGQVNTTSDVVQKMSIGDILGSEVEADTSKEVVSKVPFLSIGIALLSGLLSVAAEAITKVLMEGLLKARDDKISPSRIITAMAPIWFVVVATISHIVEAPDISQFFSLPTGILLSNGLPAIVVAYSVPAVIELSSATTFALAESFRQTFVTFLACVVYNIPIGVVHAVSFFLGFAGFAKYAEKEVPRDGRKRFSDYHKKRLPSEDVVDQEANSSTSTSSTEVEDDRIAEATGASVNLFIVLCGFMLTVLVMASMTTRPILSQSQAIKYQQNVLPYEQTKVATIIETRNLPHLGPLILQFLTVLPSDWPMIAWCSAENIEVLRQIPAIQRNVDEGRLDLRLFPHQFDIHDQEYLSRFLTKPWFWEAIEKEWILFFQSDSVLCSKSPQKIDDWIGFDWVGAPWEDSVDAKGGNGGLSMRKRSSMIKLTSNPDIAREEYGDAEDVWFSKHLQQLPGVRWPTVHQAKFSVENIFGAMSEWSWRPLGVHSGGEPPDTWRSEESMNRLMDWCPELRLFYDPRKIVAQG